MFSQIYIFTRLQWVSSLACGCCAQNFDTLWPCDAKWRHCSGSSVSGNGLLPVWHQAINKTNAAVNYTDRNKFLWNLNQNLMIFFQPSAKCWQVVWAKQMNTRPALERRKTLGHLRSINRNMIIHFANQSQTCQLFKILKNFFFFKLFMKRNCEKWCGQSQVVKIHIDYQERHINIYIYLEFLA